MKILRFLSISFLFLACQDNSTCSDCGSCGKNLNVKVETLDEALERGGATPQPSDDVKESTKRIEAQYGEQWDFCDCVNKGDSLNKAIAAGKLSDDAFDRLSRRFDEIERRCKAFKIEDPSRTPQERIAHEKRVKDCLENYADK